MPGITTGMGSRWILWYLDGILEGWPNVDNLARCSVTEYGLVLDRLTSAWDEQRSEDACDLLFF